MGRSAHILSDLRFRARGPRARRVFRLALTYSCTRTPARAEYIRHTESIRTRIVTDTVRVSPDPFPRARGLKNQPFSWRRLPFGDAFQPAARAGGHAGASELRKVRGRASPPTPGAHPAPPRWLARPDRDGGTAFCPAAALAATQRANLPFLAEGSLWEGQAHRRLIVDKTQATVSSTNAGLVDKMSGRNCAVSLRGVERSSRPSTAFV
jgi:hypothetical protein